MLSPIRGFAIATLAVMLSMASAQADENQTKIDLQASLLSFLDASADSQGRFRIIDRESGKIIHVHAGAMHPKIVPFGEDRILCIEMFDSEGGQHDADSLLVRARHRGAEYNPFNFSKD